ncbi:MAG: NAD(P)H-dependent oxidoreductase subunit E, partial [Victivallales bacterium]|nr:NAD(P)H-dependent oxidoreductase subunit E [Victivallales bacterium]
MDLRSVIYELGAGREDLIPLLRCIQSELGYLSEEVLMELAELTGISASEIISVATFYSEFRTRPTGKHIIGVCVGTACHVKGADQIRDAFKAVLGIDSGSDTDADM